MSSESIRLITLVLDEVLASIQSTEARDHTARCLQNTFGPPARQAYNIYDALVKKGEIG